jgi:hypothetical protein
MQRLSKVPGTQAAVPNRCHRETSRHNAARGTVPLSVSAYKIVILEFASYTGRRLIVLNRGAEIDYVGFECDGD